MIIRGGNAVFAHELFRKGFAALNHRGLRGRSEYRQAACFKLIDDPGDERGFRADHRQVDARLLREMTQSIHIRGRYIDTTGRLRNTRIAGRAKDFADQGALRQLPYEGMLAPTRAD